MSKISLTIDGQKITAPAGKKLLWVALENDIYIPNLCAIEKESRPSASCRLCFVEIEGANHPVTSCTETVKEGMKVKTRSTAVDRLVKTAFELLLSDHHLNCAKCAARKYCELLKIAKERSLKLSRKRFPPLERNLPVDNTGKLFVFDRNKCVLCGKCIWVDRREVKAHCLGFSRRGLNRVVTTYQDMEFANTTCDECAACIEVCPVGALYFKESGGE